MALSKFLLMKSKIKILPLSSLLLGCATKGVDYPYYILPTCITTGAGGPYLFDAEVYKDHYRIYPKYEDGDWVPCEVGPPWWPSDKMP